MNKGPVRDQQLATLIQEELELVFYSSNDERLSELTISKVEPAPGGKHFIVFVVPDEGSESFQSAADVKLVLDRAAKYLRSALGSSINLKRTPDLTFLPDPLHTFA